MLRKLLLAAGVGAAVLLPTGAGIMAVASPAGASLPTTLTFASGSTLHIRVGIFSFTIDLATGVDGTDPRGSVAVTVTGSHFSNSTPYGAPGNNNGTVMEFRTGTIVGTLTGSTVTKVQFVTASGTAPEIQIETGTTGIQNCAMYDVYTEPYSGTTGALTLTTGASTYRTHAYMAGATGATCPAADITYFDTYSATATLSGTITVS